VKPLLTTIVTGVLLTVAVPGWTGEVKVSFSNGLVTLVATDASPRQILTEWARLGQVRVTNIERLAGAPVSLQLKDVSEAQALETVLRGTVGYVAAPRQAAAGSGGLSRYDRIVLMPGVAPAAPAASSAPASQMMNRGRIGLPMFDTNDDSDEPFVPRGMPTPAPTGMPGRVMMPGQSVSPGQITMPATSTRPVPSSPFDDGAGQNAQPGAMTPNPGRMPTPAATPGAPTPGAATPGVVTAAPPAPPGTTGPIKK
jgi:hypothetical protein